MTIRVLISGATGRMGQATVTAISNETSLTLVGQIGSKTDLATAIKESQAQVVVDFTTAEVAFKNARTIIDANAHPVIGTSGLTEVQIQELQKICAEKKLGGIIAPNFSLGAVLMMKFAQEAARYFPYTEIIEMHHDGKQDSPSGTALRTAEMMAKTRSNLDMTKPQRETIIGARGAKHHNIPIHAIRLPGLVAHQLVIFGGTGETLTIKHDSIDRQSFMPGVCLACKKVASLQELIYGLEHVL
jgi:4-hydroxy-tetrahydrodipicolinate reductase